MNKNELEWLGVLVTLERKAAQIGTIANALADYCGDIKYLHDYGDWRQSEESNPLAASYKTAGMAARIVELGEELRTVAERLERGAASNASKRHEQRG